jgi:tRNA (cmo5U34)-methyltransferase
MTPAADRPHWGDENSADFLELSRYFVPERELQIEVVCELVPSDGPAQVIDLCCGDGILSEALLRRFPDINVRGLDGSAAMLDQARRQLAPFGRRFTAEHFELADSDWREGLPPCRAVVSSLAVHHLEDAGKQRLFSDMLAVLGPGGALVIADLIDPASAAARALAARQWDEAVRRRSLELAGSLEPYRRFLALGWNSYSATEPDPVDKMAPLLDQLEWMKAAGFSAVDTPWAHAGHAIFVGYRPV